MQPMHPSGRSATPIPHNIRPWLIVPKSGDLPPRSVMQDAWLHAKERQKLKDGRSACIVPVQLQRLDALLAEKPMDQAGSAEIFLLSRHNNLCRKLGFQARSKGGAQ